MNKVLVTGAAGFIGSHTVNFLVEKHCQVLALDNFSTGRIDNLRGFRGFVEVCDITDEKIMDVIFDRFRPECVIHLAAQSSITTSWADPQKDMQSNIAGTLKLLMVSRKYAVKRFIFASTSAVYGKSYPLVSSVEWHPCIPDTPYGIGKLAAEHYIRMFFPNHVILRYANVYGPRQQPIGENQVVARAFDHFIHGADFAVTGHGNQKRDFVYVGDVAAANYLVMRSNSVGTFNLATGRSRSVNDVLREIEKYYAVEGYRWTHTEEQDARGNVYMNVSKFHRVFGYKPSTDLATGIQLTAEWWSNEK